MPLDLAAFDLRDAQRLRIALLQEVLDHCPNPRDALAIAIEAEGWIVGKVEAAAEMFAPELLVEIVRPLVSELIAEKLAAPVEISEPVKPDIKFLPLVDAPEDAALVGQQAQEPPPSAESPVKDLCPSERAIFEKITAKLSNRVFNAADVSALSGQSTPSSSAVLSRLVKLNMIERVGHGQYSTLNQVPPPARKPVDHLTETYSTLPLAPATPTTNADSLADIVAWMVEVGLDVREKGGIYLMNDRVRMSAETLILAANKHREGYGLPLYSLERAK